MEAIEALARIDASVSWVVGNLALGSAYGAAFLPARSAQRIFADRVPPMAATNAPKGQAEPVVGGYRVNGRWPSGVGFATLSGSYRPLSVPVRPELKVPL